MIMFTMPFDTIKVYFIAAFRDAIADAVSEILEFLHDEDGSSRSASAMVIANLAEHGK